MTYHVVKHRLGWALRKQGASRALRRTSDKDFLMEWAKEFMRGKRGTLVVHKSNGLIESTHKL